MTDLTKSGESNPDNDISGGFFDYNDLATHTTPLTVTGGAGFIDIPNDMLGENTSISYPPNGVTKVWDGSSFDWSELKLGDQVGIRIDLELTTTSVNTEIEIDLFLGTGGGAYQLPFVTAQNFKSTGTYHLNNFDMIYMGYANTLDNGGILKISSDKTCTLVVNGWYTPVFLRASS